MLSNLVSIRACGFHLELKNNTFKCDLETNVVIRMIKLNNFWLRVKKNILPLRSFWSGQFLLRRRGKVVPYRTDLLRLIGHWQNFSRTFRKRQSFRRKTNDRFRVVQARVRRQGRHWPTRWQGATIWLAPEQNGRARRHRGSLNICPGAAGSDPDVTWPDPWALVAPFAQRVNSGPDGSCCDADGEVQTGCFHIQVLISELKKLKIIFLWFSYLSLVVTSISNFLQVRKTHFELDPDHPKQN